MDLFAEALNRPEFKFTEVLVPWILIVGVLGFLAAWLVVAILERTGLSRHVWHLPLFFVGLVVLFSSLIGMAIFP
jgi:predicted naringenin-chalcone synthase